MSIEYTAVVYTRTGLNATNLPENKNRIADFATTSHEITGLTLRQDRFLNSVRLPLQYDSDELYDADYMIIYKTGTSISSGFCYFVTGVSMVADDTAELSLAPDFLTTVGMDSLTIVDGVTVRSTWALNNIPPWELDQGDSYIAPSGMMRIVSEWHDEGDTGHTLIESTIDIVGTSTATHAVTCDGQGSNPDRVTYPVPEYVDPKMYVNYKIDRSAFIGTIALTKLKDFKAVGSTLIDPTWVGNIPNVSLRDENTKEGLSRIRGLGLESAILNQYYLPTKYGAPTHIEEGKDFLGDPYYYINEVTGYAFDEATGGTGSDVQLIMDDAGTKEAGVLNYSDFCKYGLMTASGDSIEVDPKDLGEGQTYINPQNPKVRILADPRPEGRPYFRFRYMNGGSPNTSSAPDFFRNAIAGLQWKKLPLVFTEASGNILNKLNYESSRRLADVDRTNFIMGQTNQLSLANQSAVNQKMIAERANRTKVVGFGDFGLPVNAMQSTEAAVRDKVGGLLTNTALDLLKATGTANILQLGQILNTTNQVAYENQLSSIQLALDQAQSSADTAYEQYMYTYSAQKLNEMLSYGLAQNCVVPSIMFPYDTEALRDFCGNGVLVYRYFYSDYDKTRIKKILRAYGAKYTMYTQPEHFKIEQGKQFAYVETSGVSLGSMPIWLANGAATQLNNGVRIWNTRPYHIQ